MPKKHEITLEEFGPYDKQASYSWSDFLWMKFDLELASIPVFHKLAF